MLRNKVRVTFVALFLVLFIANISIAEEKLNSEAQKSECNYPDYSYEFTGNDKLERYNRKMFAFNLKLNKYVLRPVNKVWASIMPKYGMERLQNLYTNIEYPVRAVSCLLQKNFKGSLTETIRFITNTTIGLGGLYDPAKNHFKIEPQNEDMEQVLAHYNVKKGPYIVLPILPPSNARGIAGEVLDVPLNPSSYFIGPIPFMVKAGFIVNRTSCAQAFIESLENGYADPYEITKKLYGVDQYIKNENIDKKEVYAERVNKDELPESSITGCACKINPDVILENYNPQNPITDSMRTAFFEVPDIKSKIWSDMSIWNRSFCERIKTGSIKIDDNLTPYRYRYILQKNKNSPLAIIYPSIGEGIMSHHPVVMAKLFYDAGYSVILQGSTFGWEFAKSMPAGYIPGLPMKDAQSARIVTKKIIDSLESKKNYHFENKLLIGTSFGALTTLFVGAAEEKENTLNISNYISISPPVELLFSLKQIDKNTQDCITNSGDIKLETANALRKVVRICQEINKGQSDKWENLPFTEDESKLIIGFIMKQKLDDLVFTIEKGSTCKCNKELYKLINSMSYFDYAKRYLNVKEDQPLDQFNYDTSLYSITDFLQKNKNYKIYHSLDDYFVNKEQLKWLKKICSNKTVIFSNGSHLGFLYRKEFLDNLKKDIAIQNTEIKEVNKDKNFPAQTASIK